MVALTINDDILFPVNISYGSRKISGDFGTRTTFTRSGKIYSNQTRAQGIIRYDVAYGIKKYEQLLTVEAIFNAMGGQYQGFLFKDHLDFNSAADRLTATTNLDQEIGIAASADEDFQIIKSYTTGSITYSRNIYKPISGTMKVAVNGVAANPAHWFVDYSTGILSLLAAAGSGPLTVGYDYYLPMMFEQPDFSQVLASFEHGEIEAIIVRELTKL